MPAGQPTALIRQALDDVPVEFRDRFERLIWADAEPFASLRLEVAAYLTTVQHVGALVRLLDLDVGQAIAEACEVLLADSGLEARPDARRLVQAAVVYFVREEDDDEITGVLGFDDDAAVLNAVARALERHALIVQVTPDL